MKKSIIWTISVDILSDYVKSSVSYAEVLRKLGLRPGNTTINLKKRLNVENIDYSHLKDGQGCLWSKGKSLIEEKDILKHFCVNSNVDRQSLKKYILRFDFIKYECSICFQKPVWNNKKMVLILDHINGERNDNRLENLRFVCPNCNSQLPTTCRKNNNKKIVWDKEKILQKLRDGHSKRKCLLDLGLSDGINYQRLNSVINK